MMPEADLNPGLRQIAEQYLGRPLAGDETQTLFGLQQQLQRQPAPTSGAVQQARQQAMQLISQGQHQASSGMRHILESIHQSSSVALQVQEQEEQAILKLLEGTQTLAELRPSALQPGRGELQPASQLALTQIADHLSNLARQEVERCFQQTFGPLTEQLQALAQQMQSQLDAAPAPAAPATPVPMQDDSTGEVHEAAGTASKA